MSHLTSKFVAHYHAERPHQGKEHELLIKAMPAKKGQGKTPTKPPADVVRLGEIECPQRLSGLLKHYRRKAA
jgi:putative transposase